MSKVVSFIGHRKMKPGNLDFQHMAAVTRMLAKRHHNVATLACGGMAMAIAEGASNVRGGVSIGYEIDGEGESVEQLTHIVDCRFDRGQALNGQEQVKYRERKILGSDAFIIAPPAVVVFMSCYMDMVMKVFDGLRSGDCKPCVIFRTLRNDSQDDRRFEALIAELPRWFQRFVCHCETPFEALEFMSRYLK